MQKKSMESSKPRIANNSILCTFIWMADLLQSWDLQFSKQVCHSFPRENCNTADKMLGTTVVVEDANLSISPDIE